MERMLLHILFKKPKQDVPDSCHKIMCDNVLSIEWQKRIHMSFSYTIKIYCPLADPSVWESLSKMPSEDSQSEICLNSQTHHHHWSLGHVLTCLITGRSSSVIFLPFAIRGKEKFCLRTRVQGKLRAQEKDGVSGLQHLLGRRRRSGQCSRHSNGDAMRSVSLLRRPARCRSVSPCPCIWVLLSMGRNGWRRLLKWYVGGQTAAGLTQDKGELRFPKVKIYKSVQRTYVVSV